MFILLKLIYLCSIFIEDEAVLNAYSDVYLTLLYISRSMNNRYSFLKLLIKINKITFGFFNKSDSYILSEIKNINKCVYTWVNEIRFHSPI